MHKPGLEYAHCFDVQWGARRGTWKDRFLEYLARITLRPVLILDRCATIPLPPSSAGVARSRSPSRPRSMKSCGLSLTAAARSLGVANDEEKMATEIEEDFPKLTAQEKESLLGIDRLDGKLQEQAFLRVSFVFRLFLVKFVTTWSLPPLSNTEPLSVLYLQFTVWISWASRRWRQNEGLAVKGMPLKQSVLWWGTYPTWSGWYRPNASQCHSNPASVSS